MEMEVGAVCCLVVLSLPIVVVVRLLPPPWRMSRVGLAVWLSISILLPVALIVLPLGSPAEIDAIGGDDFLVLFLMLAAAAFVFVASGVEIVMAIVARSSVLAIDGGLRALLLGAGWLLAASVGEVGWNGLRSLLPAYACHEAKCADAVVSSLGYGGAFGSPRCFSQLFRLGDPSGGRVAVARLLYPQPFDGIRMTAEQVDRAADVTSLGRGFYHAITCEEQ